MLTLNQIVKKIEEIATAHKQINDFAFVNGTFDFGADGAYTYPILGLITQPGTINGKVLTNKFTLFFCDLEHKDQSNDVDVWSDQQQVLLDVYAEWRTWLMNNDIELDGAATISDFVEMWDDEVAGWQIDIAINQFYSRDTCQIPGTIDLSPIETGVNIVDQQGNVLATLYYGQNYTVEVLKEVIDTINNNQQTIIDPIT